MSAFTEQRFWPVKLRPKDFQLPAVEFVLTHERRAHYLAADPGLGKTVIAALLSNRLNLKSPHRIYYVCPPGLTSNTRAEFQTWGAAAPYLIPDTLLAKPGTWEAMRRDLKAWRARGGRSVLIVDEAHRYSNDKSQRSEALWRFAGSFSHVLFLSGSPMPNSRPVELWPILKRFAPDVFGTDFFSFGKKYCGAHQVKIGWNRRTEKPILRWSFDGFTNKKEFKARLFKSFMLRIKKADLDLGIPEKMEGLLTVGDGMPPVISKLERKILEHFSPEDLMAGKLASASGKAELHLAEYLKLLGEYKLKYVFPYIQNLLTETKEKIIIFAHHKSVIAQLETLLTNYQPCVIAGKVPPKKRQAIVDAFQTDPKRRVMLANIIAGGIGYTMTRARRVLILEPSWRDGDNGQAGDRAHRIGQDQTVTIQYIVLRDSFERRRMEILLNKRRDAV